MKEGMRNTSVGGPLMGIGYTNCVRGVAALVIVVFHVLIHFDINRVFNLPGSVAVAAFLFLSGYGINESFKRHALSHFWRKRLARVVVPYWIFLGVLTLIKRDTTPRAFLLDATFVDSEFWFVACLMHWYLAYWVGRRLGGRWLWVVLVAFGLLSLNFLQQLEAEQSASFLLGVCCSEHIARVRSCGRRTLAWWALGGLALGMALMLFKEIPTVHAFKGTLPYHYILLLIKMPLAVPLLLLPVFIPVLLRSRLLHLCGISSLELYLVHLPLSQAMEATPQWFVGFVVLTVSLTWMMYQLDTRVVKPLIQHGLR